MDRKEIVAMVNQVIADVLEIDPSRLADASLVLREEFKDADSLAFVEIAEGIEAAAQERFGKKIQIDEEDLNDIKTLCDVHDMAERVLKRSGS